MPVRKPPHQRPVTPRNLHPAAQELPTNAELKRLLELTVTRLESWKAQVETSPNPRLVHTLKSIVAQIETLTELTEAKISYSYKALSRQMSLVVEVVAELNIAITDALLDDDLIDEREEERINDSLRRLFQEAVHLIRIVQQAFTLRREPRLPEVAPKAGAEVAPKAGERS
jgi:hypothetical protein